jgi:hypothetical protein
MKSAEKVAYQELEREYMAYRVCGKWYCLDHAIEEDGNSVAELKHDVNFGHVHTIHESTVEFEQYSGELIPREGVYCETCKSELYPPFEM